ELGETMTLRQFIEAYVARKDANQQIDPWDMTIAIKIQTALSSNEAKLAELQSDIGLETMQTFMSYLLGDAYYLGNRAYEQATK
ncbi:MAG: hypothetical protein ACRD6Q_08545, partial [Nitrososphaeraceae archaeon]